MPDFNSLIKQFSDLPLDDQKKAGQAIGGAMTEEHEKFLETLLKLLEGKQINPANPQSFLNDTVYNKLTEVEKDTTDLALMNLSQILEDIIEFRLSKETPDSSPQLQNMIDSLWQMKSRIEENVGDVFKF